jgi:hypothetical protein
MYYGELGDELCRIGLGQNTGSKWALEEAFTILCFNIEFLLRLVIGSCVHVFCGYSALGSEHWSGWST